MVCSWLVFMWMFPVATAIQHGGHFKLRHHVLPSKINACGIFLQVLCRTRRSFIRSVSCLSYDTSYLKTGVKGCSKIRRVLAKSRLILDEMCCLYRKFVSYSRHVLCKTWFIFPHINGLLSSYVPQVLLQIEICSALNLSASLHCYCLVPLTAVRLNTFLLWNNRNQYKNCVQLFVVPNAYHPAHFLLEGVSAHAKLKSKQLLCELHFDMPTTLLSRALSS